MRRLITRVPAPVRQVMAKLEDCGFPTYLVGGPVRDLLLGRAPPDWDLATAARPAEVLDLFSETRPTGLRYGTVTVLQGGQAMEVTTFRTEGDYADRRRPNWVSFVPRVEDDLARRDFTCNAMALDRHGSLVDPQGGTWDLCRGVLRAVGDAAGRFGEDPLRMLRAVRFTAQLELRLDPATRAAIGANADDLRSVSTERVRDEVVKCLLSPRPAYAMEMFRRLKLLPHVLPELAEGIGVPQNEYHTCDVWEHSLLALENAPRDLVLRLAALLHDVGKPRTLSVEGGHRHFFGHERVGAEMARQALERLRFERQTTEAVVRLVRDHMALHLRPEMREAAVRRLISQVGPENVPALLALRRADRAAKRKPAPGVGPEPEDLAGEIERIMGEGTAVGLKDLAVDGHDVMAATGLASGPEVGRILNQLLDEILDDPRRNHRETLLARAREIASRR